MPLGHFFTAFLRRLVGGRRAGLAWSHQRQHPHNLDLHVSPRSRRETDPQWGLKFQTLYASYYNRPLILAVLIKAAGPNATALVTTYRGRQIDGRHWSDLQTASRSGHAECVRLLLSAGAGSGINDRNPMGLTALGCAITYSRRHIYPILLAAGATFPPVDAALCPQAWT